MFYVPCPGVIDFIYICILTFFFFFFSGFQGEGKVKKVPLVSGQLLCLEHAVQQEYFPQHHASLLHIFLSK